MTEDEILEEDFWVPLPPVATHRCIMIPEKEYNEQQAYVVRLEAAYLQLYRDSIQGSGQDAEAIKGKMARESLKRIKAGDTK